MNGYKRPRTSEDFYLFCTYVLEYENYDAQKKEVSFSFTFFLAYSSILFLGTSHQLKSKSTVG